MAKISRARGRRPVRSANPPTSAILRELRSISYADALRWCCGRDGRLLRDRLQLAAVARGYCAAWVCHNTNRHVNDVIAAARNFMRQRYGG